MGGFSRIDLDPVENSLPGMESIHGNYPTFEIAWRANKFMKIVRHAPRGSVPKVVNRKLIADRGKADGIGNALALIQAFSIVFQCFFRKMKGLTVTLLEFHVVVQVLCTALIYFF